MTNRILNKHCDWATLVSRRFQEEGPNRKIFQFRSGDADHLAVAEILALPDGDCLRILMSRPEASRGAEEHRLDCLRMMHQSTHTGLTLTAEGDTVIIQLPTRNRGLISVAFVLCARPLTGSALTVGAAEAAAAAAAVPERL